MTPTTNKLVRLDDVLNILWSDFAAKKIKLLPTYPEPTKGSNYALLQSKLDNWARTIEWKDSEVREFIKEIQSKLIEPMEYEI